MTFFSRPSYIRYDFTTVSDPSPIIEVVTDVTARSMLDISNEALDIICERYIVQEGMTPEKVAYAKYKDPLLHWVILLINNITSVTAEWPLTENALKDYVIKKYGEGNEYDTHHYETDEGVWVDYQFVVNAQFVQAFYTVTYDPTSLVNGAFSSGVYGDISWRKHDVPLNEPDLTAGTGKVVGTGTNIVYVQLLSGVAPTDLSKLRQDAVTARVVSSVLISTASVASIKEPTLITNYEHEYDINENKRFIRVLKAADLDTFIAKWNVAI